MCRGYSLLYTKELLLVVIKGPYGIEEIKGYLPHAKQVSKPLYYYTRLSSVSFTSDFLFPVFFFYFLY